MNTFEEDLTMGKQAEKEVAKKMLPLLSVFTDQIKTVWPPEGVFPDYDFKYELKVEVKADIFKSANTAFEWYNKTRGEHSGIATTKSDIVTYIKNDMTIFFDTKKLQAELTELSKNESPHIRKVWGGDRKATGIILVNTEWMLNNFKSIINTINN